MLAVLPIMVKFPKSVPPKSIPHQKGVTSIPVFIISSMMGMKVATAKNNQYVNYPFLHVFNLQLLNPRFSSDKCFAFFPLHPNSLSYLD
jgi:hypothetical protein